MRPFQSTFVHPLDVPSAWTFWPGLRTVSEVLLVVGCVRTWTRVVASTVPLSASAPGPRATDPKSCAETASAVAVAVRRKPLIAFFTKTPP